MPTVIHRQGQVTVRPVTFTNSVSTTAAIPIANAAGGLLMVAACSNNGTLTIQWYAMADESIPENYMVADATNALVTQVVQAGRCYALPDELFAARVVKAVVSTNSTVTARLSLKG